LARFGRGCGIPNCTPQWVDVGTGTQAGTPLVTEDREQPNSLRAQVFSKSNDVPRFRV
jgi:hypothetical protein